MKSIKELLGITKEKKIEPVSTKKPVQRLAVIVDLEEPDMFPKEPSKDI